MTTIARTPLIVSQRGWDGTQTDADPTADPQGRLLTDAFNMHPDPDGYGWIGRNGFKTFAAAPQTPIAGTCGVMADFLRPGSTTGVEYLVGFFGGALWYIDALNSTWTELTSPAPAVYGEGIDEAIEFADKLVYKGDTVYDTSYLRMNMWDGEVGGGGTVTVLTNAPQMYGMTVYYGKLFGIKTAEPNTIVWSEEFDATTGYEAGGFNNAWTLSQTQAAAALVRLVGTNEALYYFRQNSIGAVRGAVTTDFINDGTREGVSESIGLLGKHAVTVREQEMWFMDGNLRPHILTFGGQLTPIWEQVASLLPKITYSNAVQAVIIPEIDAVGFAVTIAGDSLNYGTYNTLLVFDGKSKKYLGRWGRFGSERFHYSHTATSGDFLMHAERGVVYYLTNRSLGATPVYDDEYHASHRGTIAIRHDMTGPHMGYSASMETLWDRFDATFRTPTDLTDVLAMYTTSRSSLGGQDGILKATTLSRSTSNDRRFTYTEFEALILGRTKFVPWDGTDTPFPAGTIPADQWGVWRISVPSTFVDVTSNYGASIVVTAGAANYTTGYASEALAIAALPAVPANSVSLGYITLKTKAGLPWIATTDALAGGTTNNEASETNYTSTARSAGQVQSITSAIADTERHLVYGWRGYGRYARWRLIHETLTEQFVVTATETTAYPSSRRRQVR